MALDKASAYSYIGAGLAVLLTVILEVAEIFPNIQNPVTGDFDIRGITNSNATYLIIVACVGVAVAAALVALALIRRKKKN